MLLSKLKQETRVLHEQIESSLNLLRSDFTLAEYTSLLRRFYGYYSPWESRVEVAAPDLLAGRSKLPNLERDLEYLGVPHSALASISRCQSMPLLDTRPRVIGSMYVLEGATLGGQILERHFRSHFGFDGSGCEFFTGYGDETGDRWKEFGRRAEAQPDYTHADIIASAVATFESVNRWLA